MNITYGLFPPLEQRIRKRRDRRQALADRALQDLQSWLQYSVKMIARKPNNW